MAKRGRKKGIRMGFMQTYLPLETIQKLKERATKELTTISQLVRKMIIEKTLEW